MVNGNYAKGKGWLPTGSWDLELGAVLEANVF